MAADGSPQLSRRRGAAKLLPVAIAAATSLSIVFAGCGSDIPDDWTAEVGPCISIEELQSEIDPKREDPPVVSPRADLVYYCGVMAAPSCAEYPSGGELIRTESGFTIQYLGDDSELAAKTPEDCRGSFAVWAAERFEFADDEAVEFRGRNR